MIAHRIQRKSGKDSFGRLGCYVLDVKSPADPKAFDRLAAYVIDREGGGERVVGARITNCEFVADLESAIKEIESTQAQNRRSKADKSYHLVISFPEGERPTHDQLRDIEDHLVASIGYADHQRISAIHDDTDNLHIHVAINKIHPETFKAIEPHYDKRRLMAACRELELKHGLKLDNHGLAEDREAGRDAGDRGEGRGPRDGADKMEAHSGRESLTSWIEANAKSALLDAAATAPDWATLHDRLAETGLTIKPRGAGLVIGAIDSTAHVKASSVDRSLSLKALTARLGPYEAPAQDRAGPQPQRRYDAGPRHSKGQSAALYARFQQQRSVTEAARTQAIANLGQAHATYSVELRRHYQKQRRDLFQNRGLSPDTRKRQLNDLAIRHRQDKSNRKALAAEQRATLRRDFPLPTWQGFLEREASRGDEAAVAVLRSRTIARSPEGADILTAADREAARHVVYQQLSPAAYKNGDLVYRLGDGGQVTDRAHEVRSDTASPAAAFLALSLAADRFAGQPLDIGGSDAFKASVIEVAALRGFDVTFTDPDMERARQAAVALVRPDEAPTRAQALGGAHDYVRARNGLRERVADIPHHRVWTAADAGPAEYAGRRAFAGGGEAVLLRIGDEIAVLPVTSNQAAKASQWTVGDLVVTDARGRFIDPSRGRVHTSDASDDLARKMQAHAERGGKDRS